MVPGSTLMYGSNFCSRMRRPRCSSNMPIEAQVSPLPRELTTPPVTKMCLAIRWCRLDHLFQRRKPMGHAHGLDPAFFQFTTLLSDLQSRKIRPPETKGHCGKSARIPGNPGRYPLLEMNERRCRLG